MAVPNLSKSDFWHPFTCHKPLHRPETPSYLLALTLFITLKGWGTDVSHLAGHD